MSERLDAVTIPKWGIEMTHGTIVAWHKKVGDTVAAGEEIVDIETDKIVNSFEARTSGTLVRILAEIGAELPVGQLIGVIAPELVPEAAVDAFVAAQGAAVAETAVGEPDAAAVPATSMASSGSTVKISPALRRKLESAGLSAEQVAGTGPGGRIVKEDVDRALSDSSATSEAVPSKPLSAQQATVARKLSNAQSTVPLYHVSLDVDVGAAMSSLAKDPQDAAGTINDLIIVAVQHALLGQPELNKTFDGERITSITGQPVGLAVATENHVVFAPVVQTTVETPFSELVAQTRDLIGRTRAGQIRAEDAAPAAITISNLGMYGVSAFTAMVTPPQVMVLSVGAIRRVPAFDAQGAVVAQSIMTLTLGSDHRVINGAQAATFLGATAQWLQKTPS
jgi:pyruvate dehydrogenase E2 component (dihydrolipoamide acetyltransferase)|tara:strand:+ start:263 stop:1444 length:1182 start_codon:yes stop_codon:yes gene_type:complete